VVEGARRARLCLALAAALFAAPALADVVSPAPDAVAVTVYRGEAQSAEDLRQAADADATGLAMISETRTVDLPAGRTRIRFEGVADAIIPASAALTGLPGQLVERDFDYDLLDPASLIQRTQGAAVSVRRTNPKTGQVTEEPASLLTGPDGVLVKTAEGVEALGCGAGPEALIFDHLPPGLADRPTLSVVADAPTAGRYVVTLSYLIVRLDWSADYVARLAPDGKTLELTGWLTLSNRSGASFVGAPTGVVAGDLALLAPDLPDISPKAVTPQCWPMGTTTSDLRAARAPADAMLYAPVGASMVTELVVTAQRRHESIESVPVARTTQSQLGDYKLYTLAEPTTLAARQTKQIRFLHQASVRFEKLYVYEVSSDFSQAADPDAVFAATVALSFENKAASGLGLPIPAGLVSIRQPQAAAGGRELYVGAAGVRDVPVGEPFELQVGQASGVTVRSRVVSQTIVGAGATEAAQVVLAYTLANAGPRPVTFELRQQTDRDGFRIARESTRHILKNGDDVWRVTIPANGTATLGYTAEMAE
jgi:hypothetical protein